MISLKKWLTHENVAVRVGTLWVLCFVLLTVTWFVSYYFLPVGVIRDVFPSAYLPLGNSFLSAFLIIFFFNLLVGCGFTVALNLLSAKSVPIGYFYPLVQICLFGIFLGTDSFTLSHGGRFFPSPNLVIGAGFYEFTTYILVAVGHRQVYNVESNRLAKRQLGAGQDEERIEACSIRRFHISFGGSSSGSSCGHRSKWHHRKISRTFLK